MEIFLNILHLVFCISLVTIVLLQSSQQTGLTGSISGGAETFFGRHKSRTIDAILSKYTTIVALGFLVTSVWLQLLI